MSHIARQALEWNPKGRRKKRATHEHLASWLVEAFRGSFSRQTCLGARQIRELTTYLDVELQWTPFVSLGTKWLSQVSRKDKRINICLNKNEVSEKKVVSVCHEHGTKQNN